MSRNLKRGAILVGVLVSAAASQAHAGEPPAKGPSWTQLQALRSQVAILKQDLQIAKLKASIKKAGNASASESSGVGSLAAPDALADAGHAPAGPSAPALPRIVSIDGRGKALTAVLETADGGQIVATPGVHLAGGYTVKDVTPDGVDVAKGKAVTPLSFGGEASAGTPNSERRRADGRGLPPGLRELPPGAVRTGRE